MNRKKTRPTDWRRGFVGKWRCADLFSDVRVSIRRKSSTVSVSVVDEYDGEKAEIYALDWDDSQQALSFAAHWSSGRFVKYRFQRCIGDGRLELTFTFTDQELWERV